jgi:hypothetical protein
MSSISFPSVIDFVPHFLILWSSWHPSQKVGACWKIALFNFAMYCRIFESNNWRHVHSWGIGSETHRSVHSLELLSALPFAFVPILSRFVYCEIILARKWWKVHINPYLMNRSVSFHDQYHKNRHISNSSISNIRWYIAKLNQIRFFTERPTFWAHTAALLFFLTGCASDCLLPVFVHSGSVPGTATKGLGLPNANYRVSYPLISQQVRWSESNRWHNIGEETMNTWMVSGTKLKINCVNTQIPSFGKVQVDSARVGPLEKWIRE